MDINKKSVFDFEVGNISKMGGIMCTRSSVVLLRDEEGIPLANGEIFRDILE